MPLRLVFMGTGEFARPTFLSLYDTAHEVVGLFTQPDRTGRGHHHHRNPLKEAALEHGTPVFQPENVNTPEAVAQLESLDADLAVVAAYGQILKPAVIEAPRLGAINLHASLLPAYRGAAPVQYAIWKGETETGVTIFQIEPKLDAGPILGVVRTPIGPRETAGELERRLAELAVPLAQTVIDQLAAGTAEPLHQDTSRVSRAPRLKKTDGEIDWSETSRQIDCRIRAVQPWPKPYSFLLAGDQPPLRVLVWEVDPVERASADPSDAPPGTVVEAEGESLVVRTGDGALAVRRIQPAGKRAMTAEEFLRGHLVVPGDRFVAESEASGRGGRDRS